MVWLYSGAVYFSAKQAMLTARTADLLEACDQLSAAPARQPEHTVLYAADTLVPAMDAVCTQCRTAGYFDPAQLDTAILETNGQISILPKPQYRPVNPDDLQLSPQEERPCISLVIDGRIMAENLKFSGNDET